MFAESLLECAPRSRSHRRWTTLLAFTGQAILLSGALIYPLLHPEQLPRFNTVPQIALQAPGRVEVISAQNAGRSSPNVSQMRLPILNVIRRSSAFIYSPQNPVADSGTSVPAIGIPGSGDGLQIPGNILNRIGSYVPPVNEPPLQPIRISHMDPGRLVHRVQPIYPDIPRRTGIQGEVVLSALIAKDGSIENLQVLSGNPLLVPAAIEAVRQWRYKPYILNNQAVEVQTTINVKFILGER